MAVEPIHEARPVQTAPSVYLWGAPAEWLRDIAIATFFAIWMGLLGPFGGFRNEPVSLRVACYLSMSLLAVASFGGGGRLALHFAQPWRVPPWITLPVAILVVGVPMSVVVGAVVPAFFPRAADTPALGWYFQVVVLNLPFGFVYGLVEALRLRRLPVEEPPTSVPVQAPAVLEARPPRLAARLPAALRTDVLALNAEDHYVRVHTSLGSDLLLMRLGDAIAELDGRPGLRVHRSWWVAKDAIARVTVTERRTRVVLTNGISAPVARAVATEVRRLAAA